MPYSHGHLSRGNGTGRIVCDPCAEAGEVPFENDEHGVPGQLKPWCWFPITWAKGLTCDKCGVDCNSSAAGKTLDEIHAESWKKPDGPIRVRKGGLGADVYLQRDGSWGAWKSARIFSNQDKADAIATEVCPDGNYGLF